MIDLWHAFERLAKATTSPSKTPASVPSLSQEKIDGKTISAEAHRIGSLVSKMAKRRGAYNYEPFVSSSESGFTLAWPSFRASLAVDASGTISLDKDGARKSLKAATDALERDLGDFFSTFPGRAQSSPFKDLRHSSF